MNEFKVTVELSGEDRKVIAELGNKLDAILAAIPAAHNCDGCVQAALTVAGVGKKQPQEEPQPEPEVVVTPEPEAQPEPEKKIERSDIQQKVVALSAAGKKDQVREIVKSYAERVMAIPEECLGEVWEKLQALENEA